MTPVSIVALLISVLAIGFSWRKTTTSKLAMCFLLLLTHLASSVYYYEYSMSAAADAASYYFDPYNWGSQPWDLSTKFVTQLCYVLKRGFGASYLDCFLLFQAVGFAGMMIIVRTFDEIREKVGAQERQTYLILLFLPSVNFWTSAIGKDAPMFFGISLCVWAAMELRKRIFYFCIAIAVMILFRAHIALIALVTVGLSSVLGSSTSIGTKVGLLVLAVLGVGLLGNAVESTVGFDPTDPTSVSAWLDQQNAVFATVSGNTSLGNASYPVRVLSLLFRPFFFDADSALGMISSIENIGAVIAVLTLVKNVRLILHVSRRVFFMRFVLIFAFLILFSLSLVYYNVGLGLRERVMAYPMIFSALVAVWSVRQKQREALTGPARPMTSRVATPPSAVAEL